MKNYNKLPFKERKRHLEYSYNQTARQEELLIKKMIKKSAAYKEESKTDKEREWDEVYKRLKAIEKGVI